MPAGAGRSRRYRRGGLKARAVTPEAIKHHDLSRRFRSLRALPLAKPTFPGPERPYWVVQSLDAAGR